MTWVGLRGLEPPDLSLRTRGEGSLMVICAGQRMLMVGMGRVWSERLLYFAAVLSADEGCSAECNPPRVLISFLRDRPVRAGPVRLRSQKQLNPNPAAKLG
jgi:hypothetical protein